jgi:hypothetical protein
VVSEDFDADDAEEHQGLYAALRGEGLQYAWYVRVGDGGRNGAVSGRHPATAGYFARWQVLETAWMWQEQA